jgi:hypothetical protein
VKGGLENGYGKYLVEYYGEVYKRRGHPRDPEAIKAELVASMK